MENADPSARRDLERFIDRLVPEGDPDFTHTCEGPDDMPSHIKMALTRTVEVIPFVDGRLCLGTWQGVFLWEHRTRSHERRIVLSFQGR
jgi:secondary thiamine-phosphate synthase enzyme